MQRGKQQRIDHHALITLTKWLVRTQTSRWIFTGVKVVVLLLLLRTLYVQLFQHERLADLWAALYVSFSWQNAWLLGLMLALMPVNWFLESYKWQRLQSKVSPIGFGAAWRGVWAGVTISLFTPNRMGDYAGKILVVPNTKHRLETVLGALLANFSQLVSLLVAGAIGGLIFVFQHQQALGLRAELPWLAAGALLFVVSLLVTYFRVRLAYRLLRKLPLLNRWAERISVLDQYGPKELARALALSMLRYSVYSWQYYLLLLFFGFSLTPQEAFPAIALIYFLQTGVPLPPLTALAARGGIALMVWGLFMDNELAILSATFGLWLVNVIVPAIVGAFYIFQVKETAQSNG